jgi:hypothetical protein
MIVIPGHGPVGDKSQLTFYRDLLVTVRDKVAALKKEGKSLDEIVAARPTVAYDAKWGGGFISPRMFTGLVFEGVYLCDGWLQARNDDETLNERSAFPSRSMIFRSFGALDGCTVSPTSERYPINAPFSKQLATALRMVGVHSEKGKKERFAAGLVAVAGRFQGNEYGIDLR